MCGRLRESVKPNDLREDFPDIEAADILDELNLPRFNVSPWFPSQQARFPTGFVPAIRPGADGGRQWAALRWRFIPRNLPSIDLLRKYDTINSRGDRMPTSRFYGPSFKDRRCLIVADGFYEWEDRPRPYNVPWFIRFKDDRPFAIAGVWDRWVHPETKEVFESCALATTDPNGVLSHFHHRMPVILRPEHQEQWLYGSPEEAEALLQPYSREEEMESYRVSKYVSLAKNEGPECYAPLSDAGDALTLFGGGEQVQ